MFKKMTMWGFVLLAALSLVACNNTKGTSDEEKKDKTKQITKTVASTDMKITKTKLTENGTTGKNLLQLDMNIINNGSTTIAIGAFDFKLKGDNNKTYQPYPQANNFGDEIKASKTLNGKIFFEIPTSVKKATLVYQPNKKAEAEWEFTLPEKE
ncbi:DUF4352 domain-containing protein [Listeria booriae]|uniref:DUF4352 domain-containing protein n=1 Tax=Listeria booriae TaxID=1552123 RepID=A0A841ZY17_9LIST|nr:DUF4352 domain-containing protein [Listeria booriae]MBC1554071.1 DUF4352 domain-containing protein [Listeria booriae]MBC1565649.1 DUF4352 domain-containing protein [Listeria booriae]